MAPLSAAIALRIALAARALDGVEPAQLLQALIRCAGEPLTADRLGKLRGNRLRQCLESLPEPPATLPTDAAWQRAVALLKGRGVPAPPQPVVVPYRDGDMPDSVRIACTSDSGEQINAGFNSCTRLLIYQVSPQEIRLIDLRNAEFSGSREERLQQRAERLHDCQLLYTLSIGGPAAAKVVRAGAHLIKLDRPTPARAVAGELQRVLATAAPPWLAKAMGAEPPQRQRFSPENRS